MSKKFFISLLTLTLVGLTATALAADSRYGCGSGCRSGYYGGGHGTWQTARGQRQTEDRVQRAADYQEARTRERQQRLEERNRQGYR